MPQERHATSSLYMTVGDFLNGAEECPIVQELFAELEENAAQELFDESLRRQEDWNILAHQVVGAELSR